MIKGMNKVKRNVICVLISLMLLVLLSIDTYAEPKLTANKSYFDFGSIREGMNVPVKFKITNTGTKKLKIQEILTFSSCVQSRPLTKNTLAPGESIELEYFFESLGYGGVSIDKQIEIHYNNSALSPLRLNVRGNVLPLEPYQAPMGELIYNFFVLIDIRPSEQFIKEHIIGAINVPYEKIDDWATSVAKSISDEVIIYLYSEDGTESDKAANLLQKKGYSQYLSIVGGMKEWKNQHGKKFLVSGKS